MTGSPSPTAHVAELVSATAGHVLAGFLVLHKRIALRAPFPALLLSKGVCKHHVVILGAILVAVGLAAAHCAGVMSLSTSSNLLGMVDICGL